MNKLDQALSPEALGFDPEQLAERYRAERDKRLRSDAEAQFVQICLLYTSPSPRD